MRQQHSEIDFVITWVDGNDPVWQEEKQKYLSYECDEDTLAKQGDYRFRDWDLLRYWFRAVEKYAPWVRKIHFVTCGQIPEWLNVSHPKLKVVNHEDFIPAEFLPTFNANTIEVNFHRIKDLAEQFVYFNDDMFLTREVKPEDFFKDKLPRDVFALDAICFKTGTVGYLNCNNLEIINDNFDKTQQFKKHFKKWLCPKYGLKLLYRTSVFCPWKWFPGFYYQHISANYLKSTYEIVWEAAGDILNETSKCKFRGKKQVNQWLFKYWQLAQGTFEPAYVNFGRCFHLNNNNINAACYAIEHNQYSVICLNDTHLTTDFEEKKQLISTSFDKVLPKKSLYEV